MPNGTAEAGRPGPTGETWALREDADGPIGIAEACSLPRWSCSVRASTLYGAVGQAALPVRRPAGVCTQRKRRADGWLAQGTLINCLKELEPLACVRERTDDVQLKIDQGCCKSMGGAW